MFILLPSYFSLLETLSPYFERASKLFLNFLLLLLSATALVVAASLHHPLSSIVSLSPLPHCPTNDGKLTNAATKKTELAAKVALALLWNYTRRGGKVA